MISIGTASIEKILICPEQT